MGENYGKKTYASVDSSPEINFQTYVDSVKQKTTTWYIFENLMKDLTYSSIPRLKLLNAILLIELTTDYSDIDRLKYLNSILMAEFKELIEKEENSLNTENEYYEESQNSVVLSDSTEEIIKEESESAKDEFEGENDVEDEVKNEVEGVDHVQDENEDEDQAEDKIEIENKVEDEDTAEDKIEIEDEEELRDEEKEDLGPISTNNTMNTKQLKLYENIFSCPFCNKKYGINFHLKQHIRNAHEERNMVVVEKEKSTIQQDSIDETIIEIKRDSEDQILCEDENKRHENFDSLIHEENKCDLAGGILLSKAGNLNKYIPNVHEGYKDHICESCGKSFSHTRNLKRHIYTIHEGHKDYKCESCGKTFSHAHNLNKHIHIFHEGHKDHICESCGKSFSDAGYLKKHIKTIHEGHKDYKCESCGKSFSYAVSLKKHIYTIHEGHKDYKCESCGKSFSELGTLKKHIHRVHE